jgi:hypothetical protein
VWSGRLPASKRGNRLTVARDDLERVAGRATRSDLAAWVDHVGAQRAGWVQAEMLRSAADLVLADRRRRSSGDSRHAGH